MLSFQFFIRKLSYLGVFPMFFFLFGEVYASNNHDRDRIFLDGYTYVRFSKYYLPIPDRYVIFVIGQHYIEMRTLLDHTDHRDVGSIAISSKLENSQDCDKLEREYKKIGYLMTDNSLYVYQKKYQIGHTKKFLTQTIITDCMESFEVNNIDISLWVDILKHAVNSDSLKGVDLSVLQTN